MSNFNSCISEPLQPIPSHFMGVRTSFSHSYFFYSFQIYFYMYFFVGNLKIGNNRCALFTMLTKQNIINVLHSKLVKKKKKKMISLSWATCPFLKKIGLLSWVIYPHTLTSLFSRATYPHIHIGLFSGATSPHTHTVYFHGRSALKLTVVYFHGRPAHT
jgi:hypothetical protein